MNNLKQAIKREYSPNHTSQVKVLEDSMNLTFTENCDQVMASFSRKIFKPLILLFNAKNNSLFLVQ